jgi:hypothetical protein
MLLPVRCKPLFRRDNQLLREGWAWGVASATGVAKGAAGGCAEADAGAARGAVGSGVTGGGVFFLKKLNMDSGVPRIGQFVRCCKNCR